MKLNLNTIDLEDQDKSEPMPGFTKKEKRRLKLLHKIKVLRNTQNELRNK